MFFIPDNEIRCEGECGGVITTENVVELGIPVVFDCDGPSLPFEHQHVFHRKCVPDEWKGVLKAEQMRTAGQLHLN